MLKGKDFQFMNILFIKKINKQTIDEYFFVNVH